MICQKNRIRENLKSKILNIKNRKDKENKVVQNFYSFLKFYNCKKVISYYSDEYEIQSRYLFTDKVKVYYPRIKDNILFFIYPEYLKKGKYGILEPTGKDDLQPQNSDLSVIPSLAVNFNGYRLGRGGGYYDRTFSNIENLKIGLGFDELSITDFRSEFFDIKFSYFITETKVLKF